MNAPIPTGLGTKTGLGATGAAWTAAIATWATGDRATALATAVAGLITLVVTQAGRFAQAVEQIRAAAWANEAEPTAPADVLSDLDAIVLTGDETPAPMATAIQHPEGQHA